MALGEGRNPTRRLFRLRQITQVCASWGTAGVAGAICLIELLLTLSVVGLRRDPSRRHTATADDAPNPTYKTYASTL